MEKSELIFAKFVPEMYFCLANRAGNGLMIPDGAAPAAIVGNRVLRVHFDTVIIFGFLGFYSARLT